jgi:23S rRNA (adenine2503-C2)-methyltransferase
MVHGAESGVFLSSLVGHGTEEIARLPALAGEPAYRARQISSWIYRKGARDFSNMTNLSAVLRGRLAQCHTLQRLPVLAMREASDGTARKFLFGTPDGRSFEAVLLRAPERDTICVSTQIGCAWRCVFCATGAMGWQRDLPPHEILSQVLVIRDALRDLGTEGFFNLVFMGMGEPLANYDALVHSIRVLQGDFGLGVGRRRMTVSTVGLPDRIRQLAGEKVAVRLALSLNATENETRSALMPVNRVHPMETVLPAVVEYRERTGNRVTFEYVLIDGVNDSLEDARRLARLARQCRCKVNLIRFNAHALTTLRPSPPERVLAFYREMLPVSPAVTIRESRGEDILAACGQLSTAYDTGAGGTAGGTGAPGMPCG